MTVAINRLMFVVTMSVVLAASLVATAPLVRAGVTVGGPFVLTSHSGERVSDKDLRGMPFAIFFGYTNCPDVCPTSLSDMSETIESLGKRADGMRYFFVSVDPERDTPAHLSDYLSSFDPRITGLVGTPRDIAQIAKSYRVYYQKVPMEGGDYAVNHTATTYLMGRDGQLADVVSYQEDPSARLVKFRRLIEK